MANTKPKKTRIYVTVEHETAAILKRMAQLQKTSVSAVTGPLLDGITPHMIRTVAFLEAARDAPLRTQKTIAESLDRMEAEIMGLEHSEVARIDQITARLKGEPEGDSEELPPCL